MAITYKNLFPRLVSFENLALAYRKARRHKRYRPYVADFDFDWEERLMRLQEALLSGAYRPGKYRHFHVA